MKNKVLITNFVELTLEPLILDWTESQSSELRIYSTATSLIVRCLGYCCQEYHRLENLPEPTGEEEWAWIKQQIVDSHKEGQLGQILVALELYGEPWNHPKTLLRLSDPETNKVAEALICLLLPKQFSVTEQATRTKSFSNWLNSGSPTNAPGMPSYQTN